MASRLFADLRKADELGYGLISCRAWRNGPGLAVMTAPCARGFETRRCD